MEILLLVVIPFLLGFCVVFFLSTKQRQPLFVELHEKVDEIASGPTKPFLVGYQDMAYSMYLDPNIPSNPYLDFQAVCENGKVTLKDKYAMEYLAEHRGAIKNFVPDNGRKDSEYMGGEDEQWDEYYAGGVAFMEDFMAYCKGQDEKSRLIESRRLGAKELDSRFSLQSEHEDFDKKMKALLNKET